MVTVSEATLTKIVKNNSINGQGKFVDATVVYAKAVTDCTKVWQRGFDISMETLGEIENIIVLY